VPNKLAAQYFHLAEDLLTWFDFILTRHLNGHMRMNGVNGSLARALSLSPSLALSLSVSVSLCLSQFAFLLLPLPVSLPRRCRIFLSRDPLGSLKIYVSFQSDAISCHKNNKKMYTKCKWRVRE
jgi:hypothetical protein